MSCHRVIPAKKSVTCGRWTCMTSPQHCTLHCKCPGWLALRARERCLWSGALRCQPGLPAHDLHVPSPALDPLTLHLIALAPQNPRGDPVMSRRCPPFRLNPGLGPYGRLAVLGFLEPAAPPFSFSSYLCKETEAPGGTSVSFLPFPPETELRPTRSQRMKGFSFALLLGPMTP